jgi:hypothetical protein
VPVVAGPLTAIADTRRKLARPGRLPVRVLDAVPTEGLTASDVADLSGRVRDRMQQAWNDLYEVSRAPGPASERSLG